MNDNNSNILEGCLLVLTATFVVILLAQGVSVYTPERINGYVDTSAVVIPVVEVTKPKFKEIYEVHGTFYHADPAQCDADPFITADNSLIDTTSLKEGSLKWVALSRDLLKRWGGPFNYGDTLYIHHPDTNVVGCWIVHDAMNARFRRRVDFLIDSTKKFPHLSTNILICTNPFYNKR